MGDRANIVVKSRGEQVVLYTHWNGCELPNDLRKALIRGKDRWDDFQYLTRVIFCQMIPVKYWDETTGFGITGDVHDNERPIIAVDVDEQTVEIEGAEVSFDEYIALDESAQ